MRIIHPRPEAGRQTALGVDFIDGVAIVESLHPERERALLQHGHKIEADVDVSVPYHGAMGEPIIDLTSLTIPELRDIAEVEGVVLPAKARKTEIIEILSATAEPIPGATRNDDGSWSVEADLDLGFTHISGPFDSFTRTVIGDGTSAAPLGETAATE